jgi:hypothetical protein
MLAVAAGLAVAALAAGRAEATPIGTLTTADGLKFTLSDDGLSATDLFTGDSVNDTEQFTLTLDSSGYTGSATDVFSSVSLKLVSGNYDAEQLTSAPTSSWSDMDGGLNNNGCDGNGAGFFCSDVRDGSNNFVPTGGVALDGSSYMWTWLVDPDTGGFDLPGHIKAQWFTADGEKINQISEDFGEPGQPPSVPEPTTLLLMSSGLAGLVAAKRRRRLEI